MHHAMKSIPVKDNLGWLYKLTTSERMEPDIIAEVHKVFSLRNHIVHYKPKIETIGDWYTDENSDDNKYDVSKLLPLVEKVKNTFNEATDNLFPEKKLSEHIFRKIFRENFP